MAAASPATTSGSLPFAARPSPRGRDTVPGWRFVAGWAAAWALVGGLVALWIHFTFGGPGAAPLARISVWFAEVLGFAVLVSVRVIFPYLGALPAVVRLALQALTLFSATLAGSVAVAWTEPLFSLARLRTVLMILLVNAVLAVIVGIALYTYDTMRRQIEASYEALRHKEALEREIAIAREVQRELLPRAFPRVAGLELYGVCIPAVGVGGDYYDVLTLGSDRLGLVIADVSGKGIPAALLMASLQASVRSLILTSSSPAEIAARLNAMLYDSTADSRYATLFFGLYDGAARRLRYSNAGHYPPLWLRGGRPRGRLATGGPPVGLLQEARYAEAELELEAGDLLVLYTDGIVEAPDAAGEEFGECRLQAALADHEGAPLETMVEAVLGALGAWTLETPRHDDVTLVLARVR